MSDYYSVLGVSKGATDAEIKSAYKKKVVEWHPDRNKASNASDKIKEINKAYEVLADAKKKQIYDQVGHEAYVSTGGGGAYGANPWGSAGGGSNYYAQGGSPYGFNVDFGGESVDVGDIFEQFFGGGSPFGGGSRRRREPPKPLYEVKLTFEEAVHGVEKKTVISGKERSIKIPAGVDNGMRIKFSDFDLQVSVAPHAYFKRDGQDIYLDKDISYPAAIVGGIVEVPTLEGDVKLKIKAGTQPGTSVRLAGKGVVIPNSNRRGDMYITFKVKVPSKVSNKAKKLLEELEKEME